MFLPIEELEALGVLVLLLHPELLYLPLVPVLLLLLCIPLVPAVPGLLCLLLLQLHLSILSDLVALALLLPLLLPELQCHL